MRRPKLCLNCTGEADRLSVHLLRFGVAKHGLGPAEQGPDAILQNKFTMIAQRQLK